jgi:leucyl aminopeptidase (aminopeptidase T)
LRLTFSGGLLYHRAWLAHAPLEVISKPASIDVYALEQCDAILSIAAPENTDDGAAAASVHVALGGGFEYLGGTNTSAVHWDIVKNLRSGGHIELDGKIVQKDGVWID